MLGSGLPEMNMYGWEYKGFMRNKRIGGLFCALFAAALLSGTAVPAEAAEKTVGRGVYLNGVDIGGMTVDEVYAAVDGKLSELGGTGVTVSVAGTELHTTLGELGLKWNNPEILDEILQLGTSGNIVQRYKDRKDLEYNKKEYEMRFTLDPDAAQSYAKACEIYNTEPVNAVIYTTDELTPGVDGGTDGISVRVDESAQALIAAAESWTGEGSLTVALPVDRTEPDITYDELAIISDVLGTATTDYSSSAYGRAVNVENGCRKISGTLLQPGEYFSVTAAVTPFTPENGYELAGAYEENQVVSSYGGGICQVSTTLYNAVLKAELEVTARSNHTMVVNYVDLSRDAAIAEGNMDMCFVNTKDDPIYIIGYCYGGCITFTIYGHETRPANRTLELVSVTTGTTEPSGSKLIADTGQAVGYVNQTQSPHTGYSAELWKYIYIDGELTDTVHINSSYYNAVGTIYDVGVATQNQALMSAMYTAISSGDINQVYNVVNNAASYSTPQTESETTPQSETAAQPDPGTDVWIDPGQNMEITPDPEEDISYIINDPNYNG